MNPMCSAHRVKLQSIRYVTQRLCRRSYLPYTRAYSSEFVRIPTKINAIYPDLTALRRTASTFWLSCLAHRQLDLLRCCISCLFFYRNLRQASKCRRTTTTTVFVHGMRCYKTDRSRFEYRTANLGASIITGNLIHIQRVISSFNGVKPGNSQRFASKCSFLFNLQRWGIFAVIDASVGLHSQGTIGRKGRTGVTLLTHSSHPG